MNRIPCLFLILISILLLSAAKINAQDALNVSTISQYYHNWHERVYDVAVGGSHAYLACGNEGLRVVSLGDEDSPQEVAHLLMDRTHAVTLAGEFLYVGNSEEGIRIFDVSTPSAPREIRRISSNGEDWINRLRVQGNILCVCSHSVPARSGLTFIDVSDPAAAHTVWVSAHIWEAYDIEIRGGLAYVATGALEIYDVTDIASPQLLDTYRGSMIENYATMGVALAGDYACLAFGMGGLRILHLPTMQVAGEGGFDFAYGVRVVDTLAYLHYGLFECPIAIINIADPTSPQTLSIYYPPADLAKFVLEGNRAYVADNYHGLRTVDISDPRDPHEVARYSRYGNDIEVAAVNGDFAYVQEDYKLKVIDISDVRNPRERGYFETGDEIEDVQVAGNVGYVTGIASSSLYAVDLTDPDNPTLLGLFTEDETYRSFQVAMYGSYAFLMEDGGLRILDVSNPQSMQQVGYYIAEFTGYSAITVYDHYAIVPVQGAALHVLDLTDPLSPHDVASYPLSDWCRALKAVDGTLYAKGENYLWVFDLTDFRHQSPLAQIPLDYAYGDWSSKGLTVTGKFVCVTSCSHGLRIYDMTDRSHPRLSGYYQTPGGALGVGVFGDIAIVADNTNLGFYDCSMALSSESDEVAVPKMISLLPNYPNPFNATTQISFELPKAEHVQLRVFNSLGQLVSTLVDDMRPAGITRVAWNTTSAGVVPASGVYICQLRAGNVVQTQRMMLVR